MKWYYFSGINYWNMENIFLYKKINNLQMNY